MYVSIYIYIYRERDIYIEREIYTHVTRYICNNSQKRISFVAVCRCLECYQKARTDSVPLQSSRVGLEILIIISRQQKTKN